MKCNQCGHEQAGGKFCGQCGGDMSAPPETSQGTNGSEGSTCNSCGHEQASGKFCGRCGKEMNAPAPVAEDVNIAKPHIAKTNVGSFLTWETNEMEVARRINEAELAFLGDGVKGFVIGPHQRALVYAGGSLIAELTGGTYDVPVKPKFVDNLPDKDKKEGGVWGSIKEAGNRAAEAVSCFLFGEKRNEKKEAEDQIADAKKRGQKLDFERYLEYIERGDPLSLVIVRTGRFALDVTLDQIQVADVRTDLSLALEVNLNDLQDFYKEYLVGIERTLSKTSLQARISERISRAITESVASIPASEIENNQELFKSIQGAIAPYLSPSFSIHEISRVVVNHADIQAIREESERLAIAEQKLPQLVAANEFANRLNAIDLQKAQDDEAFALAMQKANQDGLLREEEMANFQRAIDERRQNHDINRDKEVGLLELARDQALDMAQQANQQALELAGLDHELDLNKRRREFEREETEKDLDLDRKKRAFIREEEEADDEADIRQLRRLQEVNNEKEDADLGRETARARRDADILQAERAQYANMSVEQIMLIRPDLDPEVVKGMVEMRKSESNADHIKEQANAAAEAAQREIERNREMTDRMQQFMENQMGTITNLASGQAAAKEKEIERMQQASDRTEERLSSVVGNTVGAFAGGAAEATVKGAQGPAASAEKVFNVAVGKEDRGRHSLQAIADQIAAGTFDPQSKVWCKGMDGWANAVQVPEIADLLDQQGPPPLSSEDDAPPPL